jgi:Polyketide cyclase / dehydrase and lipid transport
MAKVYASIIIPAPASTVWEIIRDFNALPKWTPFVTESRIERNASSDKVGCIRNFRLKNGGRIRERLLALSDYEMSCTYSILESPIGVENYLATLRLIPVTEDHQTFAEWSAEFDAAPDREDALVEDIGRNVFAAGLSALKTQFSR